MRHEKKETRHQDKKKRKNLYLLYTSPSLSPIKRQHKTRNKKRRKSLTQPQRARGGRSPRSDLDERRNKGRTKQTNKRQSARGRRDENGRKWEKYDVSAGGV